MLLRQNTGLKSVRIRSFSGLYFSAFGLNTETCSVSVHIHSECGKIRARKTPNTNNFYSVFDIAIILFSRNYCSTVLLVLYKTILYDTIICKEVSLLFNAVIYYI